MTSLVRISGWAFALLALAAVNAASAGETRHEKEKSDAEDARGLNAGERVPNGRGHGDPALHGAPRALSTSSVSQYGIYYHGGPVMLNNVKAYFIWYGSWSDASKAVLEDFIRNLGGSPYFAINTTYTDKNKVGVNSSVAFPASTSVAYPKGTTLADADVQSVVASAISSNALPLDANGVYFVLTSQDVTASSGFCTKYCGWHTHATISGVDVKYAFVGNPNRCPSACAGQSQGPNGADGIDGMASIVAHELEETMTDPDLNAWYDFKGYENADKCAWTYGTTYVTANGAKANVKLGSRDYLIQRNWKNASPGSCSMN